MTVEEMSSRTRRAWKLRLRGLKASTAAREMKTNKENIYALWYRARKMLARPATAEEQKRRAFVDRFDAMKTSGHCRCGLRLPCNGCVPTALEMAEARLGTD